MGRGRLAGISIRPARGPSADLQNDPFKLAEFFIAAETGLAVDDRAVLGLVADDDPQ
jgi:hypothetical protein